MKSSLVFITCLCLIACVPHSPELKEKMGTSHAAQETFVRSDRVKQKLYYPASFYVNDAARAQERSARAWWNQ